MMWHPGGGQRCGIKIKRAGEVLPSTHCRLYSGFPKEVDYYLRLWEEEVPSVSWEVSVNACKDGNEVCLECLDGLFSGIAPVHVR